MAGGELYYIGHAAIMLDDALHHDKWFARHAEASIENAIMIGKILHAIDPGEYKPLIDLIQKRIQRIIDKITHYKNKWIIQRVFESPRQEADLLALIAQLDNVVNLLNLAISVHNHKLSKKIFSELVMINETLESVQPDITSDESLKIDPSGVEDFEEVAASKGAVFTKKESTPILYRDYADPGVDFQPPVSLHDRFKNGAVSLSDDVGDSVTEVMKNIRLKTVWESLSSKFKRAEPKDLDRERKVSSNMILGMGDEGVEMDDRITSAREAGREAASPSTSTVHHLPEVRTSSDLEDTLVEGSRPAKRMRA